MSLPGDSLATRRIGVFKFKNIGDVLLMTPALRALRETFPKADITAIVNDFSAPMLEGDPHINRVLPYPRRNKSRSLAEWLRVEGAFLKEIRRLDLDTTIDFTTADRAACYSLLSRAKTRVAYRGRWSSLSWKSLAFNRIVPKPPRLMHHVERDLQLVREGLGATTADQSLCLRLPDKALAWARQELAPFQGKSTVHVHPVARWLYKCWDDRRMAEVIDWLERQRGAKVILTCGPEEREGRRARMIVGICKSKPVTYLGNISLLQLGAISALSNCFFGVDSAPMHIAAAVNVPVIALFGPTGEDWHPWCKRNVVLRRPCPNKAERETIGDSGRTLIDVTVDEAQAALKSFLP
jgi:lipopolysaccharide heptosyltransferase III